MDAFDLRYSSLTKSFSQTEVLFLPSSSFLIFLDDPTDMPYCHLKSFCLMSTRSWKELDFTHCWTRAFKLVKVVCQKKISITPKSKNGYNCFHEIDEI